MAASRTMITTMLIFVLYVASAWAVTMAARDMSALKAVREAIENRDKFPDIECSEGYHDPFGCDNSGHVTTIILWQRDLKGRIAAEIGNLTNLIGLYLDYNQLRGSIPSSISQLTSLQYIGLGNNQLSGRIPSSIKNLKSLYTFEISDNYFTGPIVQVNGHPSCDELDTNCLFGSSLPKGCGSNSQRSKSSCAWFCNATQVGGPCGGNGICSVSMNGNTIKCACNQGYNNNANKYTCKGMYPSPPRVLPPPRSRPPFHHLSPPPSPIRRPPPPHRKPPLRATSSPPPRRPLPSSSL